MDLISDEFPASRAPLFKYLKEKDKVLQIQGWEDIGVWWYFPGDL